MKPRGGAARPRRGGEAERPARSRAPQPAIPPLPLAHPATLVVALAAAAGIVLSVSYQIMDTDFWQHLVVGKSIWTQHRIPAEHLWTWPWYGTPETSWLGRSGWSPSWLFRALIWPVWQVGEVPGLFAWRWLTTLAVFGIAWATARRMGARGLTPLVVLVACSLLYRHRSQVRPETLAAVFMAIELWLLETRRPSPHGGGGPDRAWALVPLACAWANAHLSYFLFFLILGFHLLDEAWRTRALPRKLGVVALASLAACFVNPYGWQVLAQPFAFFAELRGDPMLSGIGELRPLGWLNHQRDGAFVVLALWPLLALWRWRRLGLDRVELATCAFFTLYLLQSERFFGNWAVAAAVYLSRDLDAWVRTRRWPAWTAPPVARAALAVAAIAAVGAAEWSRPDRPLSVSIDLRRFPVQAMDFMAAHGVGGHGFNQQRVAGYQLWRFWPDRERLPFIDVHATATPEDRALYARALSRRDGWRQLDRGGRFDYVVIDPWASDSLLEGLDADPAMALVFLDDTGALYVRREGRHASLADSFGYRLLGGGTSRSARSFVAGAADSALRPALLAELDRMAAASPRNARAENLRATYALAERRFDDARASLEAALRVSPRTPLAHYRLASLALVRNQPAEAIAEFERERAVGARPGIDFGIGVAHRQAGDAAAARRAFEREIARWPLSPSASAAREALTQPLAPAK